MKRLAIFAHYDEDKIIDDYVIKYLADLSKFVDDILFVSDSCLKEIETNKIKDICSTIVTENHGEYDFGSYKIGLKIIKNRLEHYDEIIFLNDSCYLVGDLAKVFEKMGEKNEFDFWGLTQNQEGNKIHLQSYFIVLKRNVLLSKKVQDFFESIKKESKKEDVIKNYEVKLTQLLLKLGYRKGSLISKKFKKNPTISYDYFKYLIVNDFPFIKVSLLKNNPNEIDLSGIKILLSHQDFSMISKHIDRVKKNKDILYSNSFSSLKIPIINKYFILITLKNRIFRIKIFNFTFFKKRL